MMGENDIVIGAVDGYDYDVIRPWIVSLKQTGFAGKIVLLAYTMKKDTVEKLVDQGVTIFAFERTPEGDIAYPKRQGWSIMIERFAHMHYWLNELGKKGDAPNNIMATDVRDVIFQTNPSVTMDYLLGFNKHIIVSPEHLRYKDEPWGKNNLELSFGPYMLEKMQDNPIYCAGVIAGSYEYIKDLFMQIYLLSRGAPPHVQGGGGPDQAALNVLLSSKPWTDITVVDRLMALHAGTSINALEHQHPSGSLLYQKYGADIEQYKKDAVFDNHASMMDGKIFDTTYRRAYCVVHQYDRIQKWKNLGDQYV